MGEQGGDASRSHRSFSIGGGSYLPCLDTASSEEKRVNEEEIHDERVPLYAAHVIA